MRERGEAFAEGWPAGGVRGQSVGQEGAARDPQLGKGCRQKAGNHQKGIAPLPDFVQIQPVLFSQWEVTQFL